MKIKHSFQINSLLKMIFPPQKKKNNNNKIQQAHICMLSAHIFHIVNNDETSLNTSLDIFHSSVSNNAFIIITFNNTQ